MSDLTPGTTFAPGQLVTAEILNRLVGDSTINEGVINNTHISTSFINSQVELDVSTISDDDYFLVYDSSAGNHKKIKKSALANVNNTQYTGGVITGDDGTETIIDSATGNITLLGGSIDIREGTLTAPSANLSGGNLTLDTGNVYINGTADGEGLLDVKGALYVNKVFGNIELTGGINATSSLSGTSISSSGSVTAGSALSGASLSITGAITGGATTISSLTSQGDIAGVNAELSGNLGVDGNITNDGGITTGGSINATSGSLSTKGGTFSENVGISGTLAVTGTTTLTGKLTAGEVETGVFKATGFQATGDATLKGAVFNDNQVEFSKHLIMKAESATDAGDGSNVYADEIQVNYLNDRNKGEITSNSRIRAESGLVSKNNFWLYGGNDPDDPQTGDSVLLHTPTASLYILSDSVSKFQDIYQNNAYFTTSNTSLLTNRVVCEARMGDSSNNPLYWLYATGPNENNFELLVNGNIRQRRSGSTATWQDITADSSAFDSSKIWRKAETQQIQSTSNSEYTTGKLIYCSDIAWKDGDFMGADVLYSFGTSSTPFHMRCNGNFSTSGTKNFKISHPAEPGMELRHCAIEGPKADLIYRGKAQLSQGQVSVNINEATDMCPDTFAKLVRDVQVFVQNNETWDQVRGSVDGNILTIESQNTESNANIDWMVVAERYDNDYKKTLIHDKYETCVPKTPEPSMSTPN